MDPHQTLGVSLDASKEQIENAFRAKRDKLHPDRGGDPDVYQQLKRAYRYLLILHRENEAQDTHPAPGSKIRDQSTPEKKLAAPTPKNPKRERQDVIANKPPISPPTANHGTFRNLPHKKETVPASLPTADSSATENFFEISRSEPRMSAPKKKTSKFLVHSILMVVQLLLGLISAFCVAVVLLWYFGKHDPFKLFANPKSQFDTAVSQGNTSKPQENPNAVTRESDDRNSEDVKVNPRRVAIEDSKSSPAQAVVELLSKRNQELKDKIHSDDPVQTRTDASQNSFGLDTKSDQSSDQMLGVNDAVTQQSLDRNNVDTLAEKSKPESVPESPPVPKTAKQILLEQNGGTAASEIAVEQACDWIIRHQRKDGSWSFNHQIGREKDRDSPNPGEYSEAYNGATAMALLPLLGTGSSHKEGKYQKEIKRGIDFLIKNGRKKGSFVSFWEEQGTMYSHALCALVFNEAYRMTKDRKLARFARGTILAIEEAQDPVGGGWRYKAREPGDTSVVGWQISALKLGEANKQKIKTNTLKLAEKFLDSVSTEEGAFYGYMDRPRGKPADARTAIGLLSRLRLGWDPDSLGLEQGVDAISKRGPRVGNELDCYYNYYATYLLKQYGGEYWTDWNQTMRNYLIASQIKVGTAKGSWNPGQTHSDTKGGRLYVTSLSCLTIQVYYHGSAIESEKELTADK